MPKVPISENRVQTKTANVDALKVGTLGPGIVANNVFDANQKTWGIVDKAAGAAGDYFAKEQKKESEKKIMGSANGALTELDTLLNDTTNDESGRPKGILNRRLGQVGSDTVIEYDKGVEEIKNKYAANLDDYEKEKFFQSIDSHARGYRDNVAKHQVSERNKDFDNRTDSTIKLNIKAAGSLTDDNAISGIIASTHSLADESFKLKGLDPESVKLAKQEITDKAIETNVLSRIEKDPMGARKTIEAFKDHMSSTQYEKLTKETEGKLFEEQRTDIWNNHISKMRMSDGEIDLGRAEKNIMAMSQLDNVKKEKLYDFVKSKAAEDKQIRTQREAANLDAFHNNFAQMKKNGASLEEALKSVTQYGGDPYERLQREEFVKKAYANPVKTSPELYVSLWEKVQDGSGTKEDIDKAFKDGHLSPGDFEGLRKDYYKQQLTGEGSKDFQRIKLLAEENFGNDKAEKAKFLYETHQATKGMTSEQRLAYAKDSLKDTVTGTKWFGLADKTEKKYKVDLAMRDASAEAIGMIQNDIGKSNVDAIAKTLVSKGAKKVDHQDIANYIDQIGGYEAVKKGSPTNTIMTVLANKGQRVSPENIKAISDRLTRSGQQVTAENIEKLLGK